MSCGCEMSLKRCDKICDHQQKTKLQQRNSVVGQSRIKTSKKEWKEKSENTKKFGQAGEPLQPFWLKRLVLTMPFLVYAVSFVTARGTTRLYVGYTRSLEVRKVWHLRRPPAWMKPAGKSAKWKYCLGSNKRSHS